MEKTANLLSYPPNLLQLEPTQNMDINIRNTSRDKGKRKVDEDLMMVDSQATPTKKPREMKDLLVIDIPGLNTFTPKKWTGFSNKENDFF